jgi:hypothetical protein
MHGGSLIGIGLLVVHVLLFAGVGYTLIELRKSSRPDPAAEPEAADAGETPG